MVLIAWLAQLAQTENYLARTQLVLMVLIAWLAQLAKLKTIWQDFHVP